MRKGEQGTPVVFWRLRQIGVVAEAFPESDETRRYGEARSIRCCVPTRYSTSRRSTGCDRSIVRCRMPTWDPEASAEELLLMSGARFRRGVRGRSISPPATRYTCRARAAFATASTYYSVALHELTHWSGHPDRCHRDLNGRFGDASYAAEELIAEMGAAYLCAHCRIDGELRHASYLQSWLKVLRSDSRRSSPRLHRHSARPTTS